MSDTHLPNTAPPPDDGLAAMLRGDQRLRWLQGERIPVEAYLDHYPDLRADSRSLQVLLLGEIFLRRELREPLDLADFQRRFPAQTAWLTEQIGRLGSPADTPAAAAEDDHPDVRWPALPGYEIVEEVGRGGMGAVFKARQARLNRFVALKVLLSDAAGPKTLARFRSEAEALAHAQHPYIVQILDIIEHDGQLHLALEYVGGGSLAKRIAGRPRPPLEAARLVQKLAQAMQFAHERGVVHRDLKPANILLTADGIPKITDFGLAKRLDGDTTLTQTGTVLGTPDYMAPEQAEGRVRDIGPATDIYALGVILYELLTGRPPFRGEAMVKVLDAVRFKPPVPPRRQNPAVPRDLDAVCLKCLEKDPARRYASAADLADDITRFLSGEPVRAGRSRLRTRAIQVVLVAAAAALLAAIVAAVVWLRH